MNCRSVFNKALIFAILATATSARASSVDLAVQGVGLSLGNSSRITGVRVNFVDDGVERVTGINMTLWKARRNPDAEINGAALGLIGPYARNLRGIAIGGVYTITEQDLRGIAFGGVGVDVGEHQPVAVN